MIKVLIADDEPLVRAGIKTVLPWNMYGFDVISEAADGKEAYEKILKLKPDILITDIKMPGMDGITLLKRLKQEKISIQSLVLSCFDEFELVREAMKYGAHDYIRKLCSILFDAYCVLTSALEGQGCFFMFIIS